MSGDDADATPNERPPLEAVRYDDGTIGYPAHPTGPEGGEPVDSIDLSERAAEVITWTTSTAPPSGVRDPNTLAIVEFDVDGQAVRALGQVTTEDVEIGDVVRPVYVDRLREPAAGIRDSTSQSWDGYRFEPVSE